jgi:hypothetical protein
MSPGPVYNLLVVYATGDAKHGLTGPVVVGKIGEQSRTAEC